MPPAAAPSLHTTTIPHKRTQHQNISMVRWLIKLLMSVLPIDMMFHSNRKVTIPRQPTDFFLILS